MEKTVNCNIIIFIMEIINITGRDDYYEVLVVTKEDEYFKLIFNKVVMAHFTVECGFIDRGYYLQRCEESVSSVLRIENSKTIEQLEKRSKGTYSLDGLKEFLLIDEANTVIEILSYDEPKLIKF